jgi:putative endonuclease
MYIVYIIKSETTKRYYIGVTSDLVQRLRHHNSGANRSTKNKGPWIVAHKELFKDKNKAWFRERQIKKYKGGEAFKKLIKKWKGRIVA